MATYTTQYVSIECDSASITARKWIPESVVKIENKGRFFKYKTDRNCWAENQKELNPKKAKICPHSKLELGERLAGDSFQILIEGLKKLDFDVVNNSAKHKASSTTTNRYTFIQIVYPFKFIEQQLIKQSEIPSFSLVKFDSSL
ncbi:hypothetical protein [Leptospira kmetyi]|uniref:hypothetical protein n=1 Tax=Leptospira kmetyi TaxID=408139 RepID=UPI000288851F|nr:hypothetical protein [Leptospira kmetyi]